MAYDGPPLKRARLEESASTIPPTSGTAATTIEHDEEFWFDDGSVILVAGGIAFRVYRGLLASQSSVFANMFASSCASPLESCDDCPTVHLSDSADDLRDFLRVLLPKFRGLFDEDGEPVLNFESTYATLLLAHKYDVEDLQKQMLLLLKGYYVDKLDKLLPNDDEWCFYKPDLIHAIGVVQLARLTDTPSLLPMAFYHCALLDEFVVDGWERRDGSVVHLNQEDLKRCIRGRGQITKAATATFFDTYTTNPAADCTTPESCRPILTYMHFARGAEGLAASIRRIFHHWPESIVRNWRGSRGQSLCDECANSIIKKERRGRENLWKQLPTFFDLDIEGWGEK